MALPKLTQVQVQEAFAKYQSGKSAEQVAPDYGITPAGLRWIFKQNGMKTRGRKRSPGSLADLQKDTTNTVDLEETIIPPDGDGDSRGQDLPQYPVPPGYIPRRESRIVGNLAEAQVVAFIPKEFRANSVLLQVAKAVCENEWKWPNMSLGDWLDTYLYITMKQRGIVLGSYQKVEPKPKISPVSA